MKRNHLAKSLEDKKFRQRIVSKDFKQKRIKEIEESQDDRQLDLDCD